MPDDGHVGGRGDVTRGHDALDGVDVRLVCGHGGRWRFGFHRFFKASHDRFLSIHD
jgi:hypothetical protein